MPVNFYQSKKWKDKRKVILRRDSYECQECKRYGKSVQAVSVHHIKPYEQHPELALDSGNLISLCKPCADGMHDRNGNALSKRGQALMDRTYPPSL